MTRKYLQLALQTHPTFFLIFEYKIKYELESSIKVVCIDVNMWAHHTFNYN